MGVILSPFNPETKKPAWVSTKLISQNYFFSLFHLAAFYDPLQHRYKSDLIEEKSCLFS